MDRLPKELFALIFPYLTQQDKLECVVVNRHWYEKIMQLGVLFSPLEFVWNYHKLVEGLEYFEHHPDMAHQISELVYENRDSPEDEQFVRFPILFNNLKTLKFKLGTSIDIGQLSVREGDGQDVVSRFQSWSSTLRAITEVNLCNHSLTSYLLSEPCLHLTSLSLQFYEPHYYNNLWETDVKATKDKLIANLKHATQLTSLTLIGVHLTMHDLELIHRKLPALKKLILHKFTFRLNDTLDYPYDDVQQVLNSDNAIIVTDPAPAPSLQHLEILMFYDNNLEFQDAEVTFAWLTYLGKKYTGLSHFILSFVTEDLQHTMYNKQQSEENILPILKSNPKLEAFDFPFTPITPEMVQIMDANGTQLTQVFISGYLDNVGPQLDALAESKQKDSITTVKITLHDTTEFDPDGNAGVYDGSKPRPVLDTYGEFITKPLKHFSKLTDLEVSAEQQNVSIAWLPKFLEHFKHLDRIRLHNILYTEAFGSQPFAVSHVKNIDLNVLAFPSVLALEPCCNELSKVLRLCPDLESFAIESYFFGLFPHEDVEVFGGSYYALPDDEDLYRPHRVITMKLDFRQNAKLKRITLDLSDNALNVCVYRNYSKKYTLYQQTQGGKLVKVNKSLPTTEYYATLYLSSNPVIVNNTLIKD